MPPRSSTAAIRYRKAVAARIRGAASQRKLSLAKLADFSGMSRSHFARLLAAKQSPTLDTLFKLAETLKVSVRELLPE